MLKDLNFKYRYSTGKLHDPIEFFTQSLSNSIKFDLGLGYFSTASINVLSTGFAHFISNGGIMRLYINQFISDDDLLTIKNSSNDSVVGFILNDFNNLCKILSKRDQHFFECITYLISQKRIEIKIVIPRRGGIAHEKFGIFTDLVGDSASFIGSLNFTANALLRNIETIDCDYSWKSDETNQKINESKIDFNSVFNGENNDIIVIEATQLENEILKRFPVKEIDTLLEIEAEIIKELIQSDEAQVKEDLEINSYPQFPFKDGPREYQKDANREWIKKDYQGIFAMATGTGKTITSLNCALEYSIEKSSKENPVYMLLILAPTIDLVKQWKREVEKFKFKNIYIVSGENNWRKKLTELKNDFDWGIESSFVIISTYDSFVNPEFQLILCSLPKDLILIADEAHNIGRLSVRNVFDTLKIKMRIALSATPKRNFDTEGTLAIEKYFNDSPPYCYNFSMERAIKEGHLMQYLYYPRIAYLDIEEMEQYVSLTKRLLRFFDKKSGEFAKNPEVQKLLMLRKQVIHKAKDKYRLFKDILTELSEIQPIKYCFVYVPEGMESESTGFEEKRIINEMVKITRKNFPNLISNTYLGGDSEKDTKLKGFSDGIIDILFAMKCLDEGVDVPRAEIGIFASSTGNPRQFIQRRGRLLRTHDDKTFSKIFDMIVVPNFQSELYDKEFYDMERSLVKSELTRVAYFASLATNYHSARASLEVISNFYKLELSTLILELQPQ